MTTGITVWLGIGPLAIEGMAEPFSILGMANLLPIVGVILYTVSIYQKNIKVYRILAIPMCLTWLLYAISIASPIAILLETLLLGVAVTSIGFYGIIERVIAEKEDIAAQTKHNIQHNA